MLAISFYSSPLCDTTLGGWWRLCDVEERSAEVGGMSESAMWELLGPSMEGIQSVLDQLEWWIYTFNIAWDLWAAYTSYLYLVSRPFPLRPS